MSQRLFAFSTVIAALSAAMALAGSAESHPGHPRICGQLPLEKLPHGVRFEFAQELVTGLDLRASEPRSPASRGATEIDAPEELQKPQASCVFVRSAKASWRWHRNTHWNLLSVRQTSRARGESTYALDLANRGQQTISLQCKASDAGRPLTAEAFEQLFGEQLHPSFVLDGTSCG